MDKFRNLWAVLSLAILTAIGAHAQTVLFSENFDACEDRGGRDGQWSGFEGSDLDASLYPRWTMTEVSPGYHCIRGGKTGSVTGSITTPTIEGLNGDATLTFQAGAWNTQSEKTTLTVKLTGGGSFVRSDSSLSSTMTVSMKKGAFKDYTLSIVNGTSETRITFTSAKNTPNRFFLDDICVTSGAKEPQPTKEDAELSFPVNTVEVTLGDKDFTAPVLSNPNNLSPIIWNSSNTEVAIVNGDGIISILNTGNTSISASFEGNETYNSGSAEYAISVKEETITPTPDPDPEPTPVPETTQPLYRKVNSITSGGHYLITFQTGGTLRVALPIASSKKFLSTAWTTDENGYAITKDNAKEFIFVGDNENGYSIQQKSNGLYLYGDDSGSNKTSFYTTPEITPSLKDQATWMITVNEDSTLYITNKDSNRKIIYASGSSDFRLYSTDSHVARPTLYERILTIPEPVSEEGYSTFYNDNGFIVPSGLTATTLRYDEVNNKLTTPWNYPTGSIVPAETAVMLKGTKGTAYIAQIASSEEETPSDNVLYGSMEDITPTEPGKYYMLTYSNEEGKRVLGFYYANPEGAPFLNKGGKAYMRLPDTAQAASMGFSLEDITTGINNQEIPLRQEEKAIYTLSGILLNCDKGTLPKGIYIVGGKKLIIK